MKKLLINLLVVITFLGCSSGRSEKQAFNSQPLELKMELPIQKEETLLLSEIADSISYIRLDTIGKHLLNSDFIHNLFATEDYLFIQHYATLKQYNNAGCFIRDVNQGGKGPNEFACNNITIDDIDKKIILTAHYMKDVYVYDFDGNLISKFDEPVEDPTQYVSSIHKIKGKDSLIFCFRNEHGNCPHLYYISTIFGDIVKMETNTNNVIHNQHIAFLSKSGSPFYPGPTCSYMFRYTDTIFLLNEDLTKTPRVIFNLGKHAVDLKEYIDFCSMKNDINSLADNIFIYTVCESDRFFFFTHESELKLYFAFLDKSSGKFKYNFSQAIKNDIDFGLDISVMKNFWVYDNVLYAIFDQFEFLEIEKTNSNKHSDNLKLLLQGINIDNNPILMKVHLKTNKEND